MKYPIQEIFRRYYTLFLKSYNENYYHSKVIKSIIKCKTEALGGHTKVCNSCGNTTNHYNSCRNRHCPNCQSLVSAKWVDKQNADVINASYFHIVFTVPVELNSLFFSNQKIMYKLIFDASAETLETLAKDKRYLGADPGFISILHTNGSNLSYHPHIHSIILGGGLTKDLKFKHSSSSTYIFPARVVANLFRKIFLTKLENLFKKNKLILAGKLSYLNDKTSAKKYLQFLKNKDWNIKIKETLHGAKNVIEYLGGYVHRIAISNSNIKSVSDTAVVFNYKDYNANDEIKEISLHPIEFIRRFIMHILPKRFVRMRHYGILSNRNKKIKVTICRNILKGTCPKSKLTGLTTAEILLKVFNIDILKCSKCGCKNLTEIPLKIQLE